MLQKDKLGEENRKKRKAKLPRDVTSKSMGERYWRSRATKKTEPGGSIIEDSFSGGRLKLGGAMWTRSEDIGWERENLRLRKSPREKAKEMES